MLWNFVLAIFFGAFMLSAVINSRKLGFKVYALRWLIGLDQFVNAWFGGYPDETVSSRCGRGKARYWYWRWLATFLDWLDKGHTFKAVRSERYRWHLPEEFRTNA